VYFSIPIPIPLTSGLPVMSERGGEAPVDDDVASRPASSATVASPTSTYMLTATEPTDRPTDRPTDDAFH